MTVFDEVVPLPNPAKYRYHCIMCGRFVPFATVGVSYNRWDGDRTDWGTCKTHGRVEVTWGEQ
jgi:hypothetical protein